MLKFEEHEYRRSILRVLLIITIFSAGFFAVTNWMADIRVLAIMEALVAIFWFVILLAIRTTPYLQRWTFAYLCTFYFLVLYGMAIASFKSGLFAWLFIFPILSYLLLGRKAGTILTFISVFCGMGVLSWRILQMEPEINKIVLANFGLSIAAIWSMAYVYESKRETVVARLHEQLAKDPLTGLLNMRNLKETLTVLLKDAHLRNEPVTVAYIDINDFKQINDKQGHQKGNEILVTVAEVIKSITRGKDLSFRYGGDEFCIIFLNCTQEQAKQSYGQRLSEQVHNALNKLTLSIGYAQTGPSNYLSADELVHQADQNMYAIKNKSKQA